MNIPELQNDLIKKLLSIEDIEVLQLLKEMLSNKMDMSTYNLSGFEKLMISDSKNDYEKGNVHDSEVVFKKNKKWLGE